MSSWLESRFGGFVATAAWPMMLILVISSGVRLFAMEYSDGRLRALDARGLVAHNLEMQAAVQKLGPARPQNFAGGENALSLLIDSPWLGVTNDRSAEPVRYLTARLVFCNAGSTDVTVESKDIVLHSGGRSFRLPDQPSKVETSPVRYGEAAGLGNNSLGRDFTPPERWVIPAREKVEVKLLFAGLEPGQEVPGMELEVRHSGVTMMLDIKRYEQVRLGMTSERIGPKDCLALLTLRGRFNPISAGTVAEELERLAEKKVTRAVVAWEDSAPEVDGVLRGWLQQVGNASRYAEHAYRHLPDFPASIRTLHFANLPGVDPGQTWGTLYDTRGEAVSSGLRSAIEVLPGEDVLAEIRHGHVDARAAALRWGASRLDPSALPIVLSLTTSQESTLQLAAIGALGNFPQPAAVERLTELAKGGTESQSEAALRGLAGSRFPDAHQALLKMDIASLPVKGESLVRLLAAYPRREWDDLFLKAARSKQAEVRIEALRTLSRIGHPDLLELLEEALHSEDEACRNEAFARLVEREDRAADEVAMQYVLEKLAQAPPAGPSYLFLMRTRDQRAVPLLLKHLEQEPRRSDVVRLLIQLGDQSVMQKLADSYDRLSDHDRADLLDMLNAMQSPLAPSLALKALRQENTQLVSRAAIVLRMQEDDAIVTQLAELLASVSSKHTKHQICNTLAAIGTPLAREVLQKAGRSDDADTRELARVAFRSLQQRSPAGPTVESAQTLLASGRIGDADRQLALAEKLDPEYPPLYLMRGLLRRHEKRDTEALSDFRKAIALDDQFTEAHAELGEMLYQAKKYDEAVPILRRVLELQPRHLQATTSLAISQAVQGDLDEGIRLASEGVRTFPRETGYPVFLYNAACVYGRAVERVINDSGPVDPRVLKYTNEALSLLDQSIKADVGAQAATAGKDMFTFMREDPDLKSLHGVPAFRKLAKFPERSE